MTAISQDTAYRHLVAGMLTEASILIVQYRFHPAKVGQAPGRQQ
tara:strand:+ start:112055 stop:112186 length:132 start_codon:yes stop_codon:yes gene_type:complete